MTRVLDGIRRRPWVVAWIGLALVTAVAVIGDDFGVFAPDTKPELYLNPDGLLHRAMYAWQPDPHLGQVNYNTGILPVAAVMTVLHATGIEPWLLQRLVMIATLLVGAWGAARLVTELTGRRGAGPWLAGVVHAWHPWTVVGAATLPVRLPHAVLPWLLLATHRAITLGGVGRAAVAGLAYGAMAGINGGVVNLLFVLPVLVLVVWEVATRQAPPVRAVGRLCMVGLFAVGISLYWLLPSLVAAGSSAGDVLLTTEDPAGVGRLSPPSEVLRGLGMWTSYIVIDGLVENPEQLALLTSAPVVVAGFALAAAGITALVGTSRRMLALVAGFGLTGAALMVGLNSSAGASPLGHALAWVFEAVPATTAFRTTNKAGSMLVLALALAIGAGVGTGAWRRTLAIRDRTAVLGIAALVAIAAGPVLPGQLHPLQVPVPDYWEAAAAATDGPRDDRLLLLPGNAQVRYLWGYRGVDDLDLALYDERHVVWRSTIPAGSAPATNLLTAFDVGMQLDRLAPASIPVHTRLLGAGTGLVRTDTDWLRNFGRPTAAVHRDVLAAPGTTPLRTFGPTAAERGLEQDVVPADLPALTQVGLPATTIRQAWPLERPLLVVGDAMAVDQLVRAGADPAARPLLYVDDLDDAQLAAALTAGGRLVLTDTNHRRSWAISSLTDSYTPLLRAGDIVADSDQRARVTDPVHQTVSADRGVRVRASGGPHRLVRRRAAGRPALAFDGNPYTGWQFGAFADGREGWVELVAAEPGRVEDVRIVVGTRGKAITEVLVETDERAVIAPVVDGVARAAIDETTERIRVTVTETFGFSTQPAAINEVMVEGDTDVWQPITIGARLPETLTARIAETPPLRDQLAGAELTLAVSRLNGDPDDPFDDEEGLLRREFTLPWPVTLTPAALTGTARPGEDVVAGSCHDIARLRDGEGDDHTVRARVRRTVEAGEPTGFVGCGDPLVLPAGPVTLTSADAGTIDHLVLGTSPLEDVDVGQVALTAVEESPTRTRVAFTRPTAGPTIVSSGQAWHPGWEARADGQQLGRPIVAGAYAAGWVVPPGTEAVTFSFAPQRATRAGQVLSLGVAGVALLAAVAGALRRRRR